MQLRCSEDRARIKYYFCLALHAFSLGIMPSSSVSELIEGSPFVEMPLNGVFKYVLAEIVCKKSGSAEYFVRGDARASYHADIFEPFESDLASRAPHVNVRVLGGGRIRTNAQEKTVQVYGYSVAYGRGNHEKACDLIRAAPAFEAFEVTWSNDGY